MSIADVGCWAQRSVQQAGPGGRLASVENPLIATRNGRPVAASSAVGSGLFENTFYSLVNLFAYGMTPQRAVDTPTFHLCGSLGSLLVHRTILGDFPSDLLQAARSRGHQIDALPASDVPQGWWIALTVDPRNGKRRGATTGAWNGHAGLE